MKKRFNVSFLIIIILVIILAVMVYMVIGNNNSDVTQGKSETITQSTNTNNDGNSSKSGVTKITGNSEITSGLEEKISLHATYYYSEIYVETNQVIYSGENILKYTNDEFMVAPYDCVITEISVPDAQGQCTNKHYITIKSTKVLQATVKVSEEKISNISIGDEAKVTVEALEKEYSANIVDISSTASNGYFTVTVEFENDGNIKIGMTGNVEI